MPSSGYLIVNLLLGSCGAGYLLYGRRNANLTATICGLLLMVVPMLISATLPLLLVGAVLLAVPFLLRG